MSDSKTMGSMADRLLAFTDSAQVHDSNYEIAMTLLKNYEAVKKMSITEIADLCYVSQASLSRFCRFLGFSGFKEFRQAMDRDFRVLDDYSGQYRSLLKAAPLKAAEMYKQELFACLEDALSEENLKSLPGVCEAIASSAKVVCFSHHFLWSIAQYLQSKLMMLGKYTELYLPYAAQMEAAKSLDETCTVILYTVSGSYFSLYSELWNVISRSGAKIVVITQAVEGNHLNRASYVIGCGNTNRDDVGKYAALAVTDRLVLEYVKQQRSEER